jgi:hypothetical protein
MPRRQHEQQLLDTPGSLSATGELKETLTGDERIFADLKLTPGGRLTGYATVKQLETANPKPVCSSGKVAITASSADTRTPAV